MEQLLLSFKLVKIKVRLIHRMAMTFPTFPKGDFRRTLAVLHAIDTLAKPTMNSISDYIGLDKKTVTSLVSSAYQAGVTIAKNGPVYEITDWGPVIQKKMLKKFLTGAFNAPIIDTSTQQTGEVMKSIAVLLSGGRVVATANTAAKSGESVSYGFEKTASGNLVEIGRAKISRAAKYLSDKDLMFRLEDKIAFVNYGGGDCV